MSPQDIFMAVQQGASRSSWLVFRYNRKWAGFNLILRFIVLVLLVGAALIILGPAGFGGEAVSFRQGQASFLAFGSFVVGAFIAYYLILDLRAYLKPDQQMLVLTDEGVLRAYRGRLDFFTYEQLADASLLTVTGYFVLPADYSIRFTDKTTGRSLKLTSGRLFGHASDIFNALKSRLPTA